MVQFFHSPTPRNILLKEQIGQSLGQGLSDFMGTYFANKSLQNVLNNPSLKDAPLSEKMGALQTALAPYGEKGQKILQQRMMTLRQGQLESALGKARQIMTDPNKSQQEKMLSMFEIASSSPEAAKPIGQMMQYFQQQRQFGKESAQEGVKSVVENPSINLQAAAGREGEKIAERGGTPAEVEQGTAEYATRYKNELGAAERGQTPPTIFNAIPRLVSGTFLKPSQQIKHDQQALKTVIESGPGGKDEARTALSEAGKPLEQREETVDPLPEETKKVAMSIPFLPAPMGVSRFTAAKAQKGFEEKKMQAQPGLNQNLASVLQSNPNANLILLRKEYEKKGYDWRMFQDAVTDLQSKGYRLTPDQQKQYNEYLYTPPEAGLDKIFNFFKIGRGR
jgi:hypothetical protein